MWSLTIMQMQQVLFSTAWHIVAFKCNVNHCALLSFLLCSSYAHGCISTSYHIVVSHFFVLKASNCALVNMILPPIPFLSSKCLNDMPYWWQVKPEVMHIHRVMVQTVHGTHMP
ncbi:hypothetical protein VPH35_030083 [Triticum aestivum]